jgi:hypothetical protein
VVVKIVVLGAADSAFIGITEKLGDHFTAAAIAGAKFLSGSSPTFQGSVTDAWFGEFQAAPLTIHAINDHTIKS